ncbi:hypothetical protein C7B61_10040 [filamentous cyanobacterium CCP1]|nr:hypothetical protein C7B76_18770 [filamentous cyanobacterium CCP2]PSB66696.1 hypothetical protein C7B61_10040 [filamentous cyanobacterium CCP1]
MAGITTTHCMVSFKATLVDRGLASMVKVEMTPYTVAQEISCMAESAMIRTTFTATTAQPLLKKPMKGATN